MNKQLNGKQRAFLRARSNGIEPVFQIGKGPIDEKLIKETDDCLAARELIKLSVLNNSSCSAREAADILSRATGSEVVQVIGSRFILFRMKRKKSEFAAELKSLEKTGS